MLTLGVPKETQARETRVAATPDTIKKFTQKGLLARVERGAGGAAGFTDEMYAKEGAELVDAAGALGAGIVLKVAKPSAREMEALKAGALLVSFLEAHARDGTLEKLAASGVDAMAMERVPRISRAQSMDALSSQANIAGYRAVIEAARHYGRFFPMMMTAAGSSKPARVAVLGAGVAGLQAIGTARRLGAAVEAYDVRAEVREQILSLGAKFMNLDVGEDGSGQGGYARELSEDGKRRQQAALTERLKKFDIIVSTANVPGRRAPVLVTEDAVRGMRPGSVVIDMAAANGGNCPLSEADQIVVKHGVTLVGITNFPALVPADASSFYARNLWNLLSPTLATKDGAATLNLDLTDEVIAGTLTVHGGKVRL